MPIKKRTANEYHKVIVKIYEERDSERVVVHQYIRDMPVRDMPVCAIDPEFRHEALINGVWWMAAAVNPDLRGGVEYEVYKSSEIDRNSLLQ